MTKRIRGQNKTIHIAEGYGLKNQLSSYLLLRASAYFCSRLASAFSESCNHRLRLVCVPKRSKHFFLVLNDLHNLRICCNCSSSAVSCLLPVRLICNLWLLVGLLCNYWWWQSSTLVDVEGIWGDTTSVVLSIITLSKPLLLQASACFCWVCYGFLIETAIDFGWCVCL
jgi:hypothetical protein